MQRRHPGGGEAAGREGTASVSIAAPPGFA
jgi:hypothetical protein